MPQAKEIEPRTVTADRLDPGTSGGERRSVTEWKNRYSGADIWVIGAGASLNFVDPEFFDGRITLGVNDVYRRFHCTCLVRRSRVRIEEAYQSGIPLILSEHDGGNKDGFRNEVSGPAWYFEHVHRVPYGTMDMSVIGTDRIVMGASILVTAMHLAAYMGARNILLCGHDCGSVDGQVTFENYYDQPLTDPVAYWRTMGRFEEESVAVRERLKEVFGCRVYSLNPFLNFGLEGHCYRREP